MIFAGAANTIGNNKKKLKKYKERKIKKNFQVTLIKTIIKIDNFLF